MRRRSTDELIRSCEFAILGAILIIGLGALGLFLSIAVGLNPTVLSGRVFVACGFTYLIYAFATRDDGETAWRVLTSFLYTFAGFYLLLFFSPGLQVRNVMVVVGIIVTVEGIMEVFIFYRLRAREGSGWIAAGAIATTLLMRLIGGIVGTMFVISGVSRLMYSVATHKRLEAIAKEKGKFAMESD